MVVTALNQKIFRNVISGMRKFALCHIWTKKKIIYEQKKIIYEQKKIIFNIYEQKKSDQPA